MRVILRKQRRTIGGKEYHPGDACELPQALAEGLAYHGLCDIAQPPDGAKKPKVDEKATAAAQAAGKKTRDAAMKVRNPKAPKKKPPQ